MFEFIDNKYGQPKRGFASDNASGVHPNVLVAIEEANRGHVHAYGSDPYTEHAQTLLKKQFAENAEVFFVFTGSAANVLGLQMGLTAYEAVICAETAHINVDECGAPETFIGCKLIDIPTTDGKLTVNLIKQRIRGLGDEHQVQPKIISITQLTEMGTLYSIDEIKTITSYAHTNNMYVHMDGARIANAACALGLSFKEMTADCGIDILSFGGTKNGLLCGEAIVFLNPKLAKHFKFYRKQSMQLASKMRFLSAQFIALLDNELWLKNARHANHMAQLLKQRLNKIPKIKLNQEVQANMLFVQFPLHVLEPLQKQYDFYILNEQSQEARLVTSFDTIQDDIDGFANLLEKLV